MLGSKITISRQKRNVHKIYDVDRAGKWAFMGCMMEKLTPQLFCLALKLCFNSKRTKILRITSFLRSSTKCHYNDVRLVCGVLRVRPGLLGQFF